MEYAGLILSLIMCFFCPFWIKNSRDKNDRFYAIFSMFGGLCLLTISVFIISFNNDILFFSQKEEHINAKINIDSTITEESSILYFFDEYINNQTKSNNIEHILGQSYIEDSSSGSYSMRYMTSEYTLKNIKCDYIFAYFNKSGQNGKIRSIAWQYKHCNPNLYYEFLDYLIIMLGEPKSTNISSYGTLEANWLGYHLECNDYTISFSRIFN